MCKKWQGAFYKDALGSKSRIEIQTDEEKREHSMKKTEERPDLTKSMDSRTFRDYYFLKEELVSFCRENKIPSSGGKEELTERIAYFLEHGVVPKVEVKRKKTAVVGELTPDARIEENFVCSEKHRAFFKEQIGNSFSFCVAFQKWLKSNAGKTYKEAVAAYARIMEEKKTTKTTIDRQFEYNTYIRDFFADNSGRKLEEAIACWKYKKKLPGHNRYEKEDLVALEEA